MKQYMDFIETGPIRIIKKVTNIPVRRLGIQKVVFVRTKANGGIL